MEIIQNNIYDELHDYILTNRNMNKYTRFIIENTKKDKDQFKFEKKKSEKINIICPKYKDTLFWCFYIISNSYESYMDIENKNYIIEQKEKHEYLELIRKNKEILKMNKINKLNEMESDIFSNDFFSLKLFISLCIIKNINVLFIYKSTYYDLFVNEKPEFNYNIIIIRDKANDYCVENNVTQEKIDNYKKMYLKMDNFEFKLKSIGNYKVDELIEICNKLNISNLILKENGKHKTKNEIYDIIVSKL